MSGHADISDYNYFDVEDFSVDSFFRSLELQSRFAPTGLEFSFPTDLENVPISSCLSSVGFLDSTTAKFTNCASELPVAKDGGGCHSGLTESATEAAVAVDNDDDDATAVDLFFHSLELRSCLLRADDETIADVSRSSRDKTDPSNSVSGLFSPTTNADEKNDRTGSETDVNVSQSSVYLSEKSLNYLSSCSGLNEGEDCHATKQSSSTNISQSETAAVFISSTHAAELQVARNTYNCVEGSEPSSAAECCKGQNLHTEEQYTARTKNDTVNNSERRVSKGGKISCKVCGIELSSKYSYVRHLLTPLHCRRADGYCVNGPSSGTTTTANTEDIVQLIARQKPIQCRICRFYGDSSSQLLYHLTSTSHFGRLKRKLVRCLPCDYVGTSNDIIEHVKSDSHTIRVRQSSRPSVISAYRSRGCHQQVVCRPTNDGIVCSYCGVKFPSASSLKIHVRRRHTGQRPFTCSVCSKSYCDNSTLTLHYRTAQHQAKCAQLLR